MRTVESLLALVARWHREGRTIVAVMHEFDQVRAHFPSALLLARSPVAWGDTSTVLNPDNLAKALSVA
jgi:zinc/manganese transport system ATP-binding protein